MLLAVVVPGRFAPRPMVASLDSDFSVLEVDGEEQHDQEEGRVAFAMQYPQVSFAQQVSGDVDPSIEYTGLLAYAQSDDDSLVGTSNLVTAETAKLPDAGTEVDNAAQAYGTALDNMRVDGAEGSWKVNHNLKSALHKYHARENLNVANTIKQQPTVSPDLALDAFAVTEQSASLQVQPRQGEFGV